jgi:hypothetical protein
MDVYYADADLNREEKSHERNKRSWYWLILSEV